MTPDTEATMRSWFLSLGATDPSTALRFAQTTATPRLRELLRNAALQGWASVDPRAACAWTLSQVRLEERRGAVEAIAAGAVIKPDEAINAITHLIQSDSPLASDHGNTLVTELTRVGQFDLASRFAADASPEYRAAWLATAFSRWAQYQPSDALTAVNRLKDTTVRNEALQGVITGWASSDPAALVNYAQALPMGEARSSALHDGLQQWVSLDPISASKWMDSFNPSSDLDAGVAAVATSPSLIEKKPEIAASWAESIVDPALRSDTLLDLIRLWGAHDLESARRYASTSKALSSETRELALATFEPSP